MDREEKKLSGTRRGINLSFVQVWEAIVFLWGMNFTQKTKFERIRCKMKNFDVSAFYYFFLLERTLSAGVKFLLQRFV